MINFHFVILDELIDNRFPGFERNNKLVSLPVWGNFIIGDLLQNITLYSSPFKTAIISQPEELRYFLKLPENEKMILGRTGNVTAPQWSNLFNDTETKEGIIKIRVGGVPSDLYILGKKELKDILARFQKGENSIPYFFDELLFHKFERIMEMDGYSFLIRNAGEYFRENLRIIRNLRKDGFLSLYTRLRPASPSRTTIGEKGNVKNSVIGNGAVVEGVVEDSVIFHGVSIKDGAIVKGSVILPSNFIESGVVIQNTLILGGGSRTIREGSIIGKEGEYENHDYPGIIRKGLTIVGEGFNIPPGSRIGAGCLVTGKIKEVEEPIVINDGQTLML